MKVDKETLYKLAHLARIEIDPKDEKTLLSDLEEILTWIQKLEELDTSSIEDYPHMSHERNVFREDLASNELTREEALKNAPSHDEQFFRVPKVLE